MCEGVLGGAGWVAVGELGGGGGCALRGWGVGGMRERERVGGGGGVVWDAVRKSDAGRGWVEEVW